jgi:2,3-dihydroxybiphenyl 1,2-dioxygenase
VFGLDVEVDPRGGTLRLPLSGGGQWVTLRQSDRNGLDYIGWEVQSAGVLHGLANEIERRGASVALADAELCAERGVAEMVRCAGPDGVATELYVRAAECKAAVTATTPRLGHVVLAAGDRSRTVDWYVSALGFDLSDHIFWDGVEASFLRCNPRHHSLALTNPVGDMRGGDLGHFMIEVDSIDEVGRMYDRVREFGPPLAFTFGRHSNDGAISFYVYTPSGWLVEYGYGGSLIDDPNWRPKLYDAPSIWGHEPQPPPGSDPTLQRY